MNWSAKAIQVILFTAGSAQKSAGELFEIGFGMPAGQRRDEPFPVARSEARGQILGGLASVVCQPGRLEFKLDPPYILQQERKLDTRASIRDIDAGLDGLIKAVVACSHVVGYSSRVSIVVKVSEDHISRSAANKAMQSALPYDITISEDWIDFQFQFNKPHTLAAIKSDLNRVLRWSVENIQFVLGGESGESLKDEHYLSSLLLDFNTVPTGRTFGPDEYLGVLESIKAEIDTARRQYAGA